MVPLPNDNLLALFRAIVDIESVSRNERQLADAVQDALGGCVHLELVRDGDAFRCGLVAAAGAAGEAEGR